MPKAVVIPDLIEVLPFREALTWERFQTFTVDLLFRKFNSIDSREYLSKGSRQHGIDVYTVPREASKMTVAQCKLVEYMGPRQVLDIIDEFLRGDLVGETQEFVLCTSADLSKQADETGTIALARQKLAEHSIALKIWDAKELSTELRNSDTDSNVITIVYRYFGEDIAYAFYGKVWQDFLKKLRPVTRRQYPEVLDYIERGVISYEEKISDDGSSNWHFWNRKPKQTMVGLLEEGFGKGGKKIILLGSAGYGKTEELNHLAGYLSADLKPYYPVRYFLRDYNGDSIDNILKEYDDDWKNIPPDGLVLILDGLDEVPEQYQAGFIRRLNDFVERHTSATVVVSSRHNFYDPRSSSLRDFEVCLLNPLSIYDVDEYLDRKLQHRKEHFNSLLEERTFTEYRDNPYYLTRLVRFYLEEDTAGFPKNKSELFKKILFEKIERDEQRYQVDELKERLLPVAERIAFCMTVAAKNSLKEEELKHLVPDKETRNLLRKFSIFIRNSEKLGTWSFEHKNLQEYLCASMLSRLGFFEVHQIISFQHNQNKLLPRFLNTVSFLFELLDKNSELFSSLSAWIVNNEPEILVQFEREQLTDETRRKIFDKIFRFYKLKKTTLRRSAYLTGQTLAQFVGVDGQLVDYLSKELKSVLPAPLAYDAIEIIATHKRPFLLREQIEEIFFFVLQSPSYHDSVKATVIETFADTKLANPLVFDKILKAPIDLNDFDIRRSCIILLSQLDSFEDHIGFILDSINIFEDGQKQASLGGSNEILKALILKSRRPASIKKILQHCIVDDSLISNHHHYKEINLELKEVKDLLCRAAEVYKQDPSILRVVYRLFCGLNYIAVWDGWFEPFKEFFENTCGPSRVFYKLYRYGGVNRPTMSFNDEQTCNFLIDEYLSGKIDHKTMVIYRNQLSWSNFPLFRQFNDRLNAVSGNQFLIEDIDVNYNELYRLQQEKNQEMLLDKELFLDEARTIFKLIARDKISYREIWDFTGKELKKYQHSLVVEAIRDTCRHEEEKIVTEDKFFQRFAINEKWEGFIVTTVQKWLQARDKKPVRPQLIQKAGEWVISKLQTLDFNNAITDTLGHPGSFSFNGHRDLVKNLFLLLQPEVDDNLLLKLLPMDYDGVVSDRGSVSALVLERVKDRKLVRTTVMNNINAGNLATPVLMTHYKLCAELDFKECREGLYSHIGGNNKFTTYDRVKLTDCYLKLGGEITDFENDLTIPETDPDSRYSSWQWLLLEKMLLLRSEKVYGILLKILNSDHKLDDKMRAAQYLVQLSDPEGLIFWSSNVVTDVHFDIHTRWEPMIQGITKMSATIAVPLLVSCVAGGKRLGQRDLRYYEEFVFASLLAIARLKHENYISIRTEFSKLSLENTENAEYLDWLTDRLEREYFQSQTQEMEIVTANTFFERYFSRT